MDVVVIEFTVTLEFLSKKLETSNSSAVEMPLIDISFTSLLIHSVYYN